MNEKYLSITEINQMIKMMFESAPFLKKVYLKGEISNFKHHTSGHFYFTLKDDESRLSAIMFRSATTNLNFEPEDGMNVLVTGRISVYPSGGNYQIYVDKMEQDGLGNLYIEFEKLKQKLSAEGLFDPSHKKLIPKYPTKIGIVTAPTGAAIKDILSTIERRYPICETILFPSLVQGVSASKDIADKIKLAQNYDLDVLIVGRGGGSIEDLWAFNEEIVARAIYESRIPVISAVGHEVDVTISDFVADKRAPTPTGAAEMAVPTKEEVQKTFHTLELKLASFLQLKLKEATLRLKKVKEAYVLTHPSLIYENKIQKLDDLSDKLQQTMTHYLFQKTMLFDRIKSSYILQNPEALYEQKKKMIQNNRILLIKNIEQLLTKKQNDFQFYVQTLKLVNPLNILEKGYSVVKKDGHIVKDSSIVKVQDKLNIEFSKGSINVEVKEIIK